MSVPSSSTSSSKARSRYDKCPIPYEIKDDRMFVRGEDRGDATEYLDKGRKLRDFLKICHEVAVAA